MLVTQFFLLCCEVSSWELCLNYARWLLATLFTPPPLTNYCGTEGPEKEEDYCVFCCDRKRHSTFTHVKCFNDLVKLRLKFCSFVNLNLVGICTWVLCRTFIEAWKGKRGMGRVGIGGERKDICCKRQE